VNRVTRIVAAIVLVLAATAMAQQYSATGQIAVQGPESWNRPGSGGTRTDMAPKFEVPAGTKFTDNPLYKDETQPAPNVMRAWRPEDANRGQCPYTPDEQQRMSEAIYIGQSGLGGLLAPTAAGVMRQVNEASDARCNGRPGPPRGRGPPPPAPAPPPPPAPLVSNLSDAKSD
jgi:hypothetical protein